MKFTTILVEKDVNKLINKKLEEVNKKMNVRLSKNLIIKTIFEMDADQIIGKIIKNIR